jgi:hypothetical protein
MKPTKRQLIDRSLFLYGGLVSFALTGFAIFNIKSINNAVTFVLFLPVSLYFLFRLVISLLHLTNKAINSDQTANPYFGRFTLATFLSQEETSFLINLVLISLAISLILFRISLNIIK